MLHGDQEEEEDEVDWFGLFGDVDEEVRVAEAADDDEVEDEVDMAIRGLFEEGEVIPLPLPVEEEGDDVDWGKLQGLFTEDEGDAATSPNPTTTEEIPPTPSSPILRLLCMSKLMYVNLPQLVVVAATAAFLNGASYTLV
jgi:hypothetical protein